MTDRARRLLGPLAGPARRIRDVLSAERRAVRRLERSQADVLLQSASFTRIDRHPPLFALARERLADVAAPRLLSFGCSTGEEPISLAGYLPRARIDAVDINPRSIAIARRKARRAGVTGIAFACRGNAGGEGPVYDAIFALSVLRDGRLDAERPERCADIMPFARFAAALADLDLALKPGGLLFLWGCNFRFTDTAVASGYDVVPVTGKKPQRGAIYGPDDRLIPGAAIPDFAFEKRR